MLRTTVNLFKNRRSEVHKDTGIKFETKRIG